MDEEKKHNNNDYELKMEVEHIPLQFNVIRGEYYRTIVGSNCVVTSIINGIKCKIIDLSINEEHTTNQKDLSPIKDEIELQTAQLQYEQYLNQNFQSAESDNSDNSNSNIEIGKFYIEGGVSCVIMDILNNNQVTIIDLFENKSRKTNMDRLHKIHDPNRLKDAELKYNHYLNKKHEKVSDKKPKEMEFILSTSITKDPDHKINDDRRNICLKYIIVSCLCPLIFGIIGVICGLTVLKGSDIFVAISVLLLVISALAIIVSLFFLYCNAHNKTIFNVGQHHNKLVFNNEDKKIYWYKNDKMYDRISYRQFKKVGWKFYVCNNGTVKRSWVNVFIVRNDRNEEIRFNGYIADKTNGIEFTKKVNSFWCQMKNIKKIENKL